MNLELTAQRDDRADEMPIAFRMTKPLVFAADVASVDFRAEVWCSDADVKHNAAQLRAFQERIGGGTDEELSLTFGIAQGDSRLNVHPGKCTLEFFLTPSNRIIVSVRLTSLQPGRNTSNLLDTCVVHFETTDHRLEEFVGDLEQSSDIPWRASLRGFEVGDA